MSSDGDDSSVDEMELGVTQVEKVQIVALVELLTMSRLQQEHLNRLRSDVHFVMLCSGVTLFFSSFLWFSAAFNQ